MPQFRKLTRSFEMFVLSLMDTSPAQAATRDRIFAAAERLFAEHGFSPVSLRQITSEARVNLAAVNYHFGSKEALYCELLRPRLRTLNEERLTSLTQAEQLAGDQPVPLPAILESYFRPLLRRAADPAGGGLHFLRLVGGALTQPPLFLREDLTKEIEPVTTRYTRALAEVLSGLPSAELFWRMQFAVGAMVFAALRQHDIERLSGGLCRSDDPDDCLRRLVTFCAAGLGAPAAPAPSVRA